MGRDSKLLANEANEQSFPLLQRGRVPPVQAGQAKAVASPALGTCPPHLHIRILQRGSQTLHPCFSEPHHQEPKHPVPGKYNQTSWIFNWIWLNCLNGKQIPSSSIPWNPVCLSWGFHMKTGVNGALGKFTLCVWFYDRRFCMLDACSQG